MTAADMPEQCKQCAALTDCVSTVTQAYKFWAKSQPLEEIWIAQKSLCEHIDAFKWNNQLTKYDFEEDVEISPFSPKN